MAFDRSFRIKASFQRLDLELQCCEVSLRIKEGPLYRVDERSLLLHLVPLGLDSTQKTFGGSQASCKTGKKGVVAVALGEGLLRHTSGSLEPVIHKVHSLFQDGNAIRLEPLCFRDNWIQRSRCGYAGALFRLHHGGRCRDGWRFHGTSLLLAVVKIQGRIADGETGLHLQIGGRLKAIFGWERLHTLRKPLGVDKKPLSKRHSEGTIRVEETQGGRIRDRTAISEKGKPDL
jgi:hypothetical protein